MRLRYLGHSCFLIENLLIDPYLRGNPLCNISPEEIKCDTICITHDHADHLGDSEEIARRNNATIVAIFELAQKFSAKGIKSEGMNIGGKIILNDWEIKMVEAKHSSNLGNPAGFILKYIPEKKKIYHTGDTSLFSDMALIGEEGIDIYLVPIGDRFTMGIDDALKSVELVKPKMVIPMHYNTFPLIRQNPDNFARKCGIARVMKIGEEIEV